MIDNTEPFEEEFKESFCKDLLKVIASTKIVEWEEGGYQFSYNKTILGELISIRFDFNNDTILKYFENINWKTFLKSNRNLNISFDLRKSLLQAVRKKFQLNQKDYQTLFHPLSNWEIWRSNFNNADTFKIKYRINDWNAISFVNKVNHNYKYETIPNENLILEDEIIALFYSCKNDLDWSKEFIEKYAQKLDWDLLSCNCGLLLSYELIDTFINYWNWNTLLCNPSLSLNIEFLERYKCYIDWNFLSSTNGTFWTENLINKFICQWDWKKLSKNRSIEWKFSCLKKYEDHIDWKIISSNPNLELSELTIDLYKEKFYWPGVETKELDDENGHYETRVVGYGISSNKSFPWNIKFMTKYKEYLDWGFIEYGNIYICWDLKLINHFSDKISWSFLFNEEQKEADIQNDIFDNMVFGLPFFNATKVVSQLNLSNDLLFKFGHLLDRKKVFYNRLIDWNFSIFYYLFRVFFIGKISEQPFEMINRFKEFEKSEKFEITSILPNERNYKFILEKINTTKYSEALILEALAYNSKLFKVIFQSYFTETNLDEAFKL